MEKLTCYLATNIISVSQGVKDTLINDCITKKNIELIWNGSINGINSIYFDPNKVDAEFLIQKYNISPTDFVFGFVGRIVKDKGINELLCAFNELNKIQMNIKLILIGPFENDLDPISETSFRIINENKNIIVVGFVNDVRPYYKLMNLFVFPSYREGFGVSILEAAAMNVPSICANIIGCNEIIIDKVNGFLIVPKNEKSLYNKMKYCLSNKDVIVKMSEKVRKHVLTNYDQKKLWQFSKLHYLNILKNNKFENK
jgi:glycosyltransferase involved in cell wall biosynthesis